jgi:hypothetical protein
MPMDPVGTEELLETPEEVEETPQETVRESDLRSYDFKVRLDGTGTFPADVIAQIADSWEFDVVRADMRARTAGGETFDVGLCCYVHGTVEAGPEENVAAKIIDLATSRAETLEPDSWWYNAGLDDLSFYVYRHAADLHAFKATGYQIYTINNDMPERIVPASAVDSKL